MDKALLDTDTFSEIMKAVNHRVLARSSAYLAIFGRYTLSTLTVVEIVRGFHKRQREERIQAFLADLPTLELLTLDARSAEVAGRIDADLERIGQTIGRADPMIAAIALTNDLTLVTGNQAHYQRIQSLGYGLKIDNWRS